MPHDNSSGLAVDRPGLTPPRLSVLVWRSAISRAQNVIPTVGLGLLSAPLLIFLGWLVAEGHGVKMLAVAFVVLLPMLTVRTRWAVSFAVAPILLYPVTALSSPKVIDTLTVGPLVATYLAVNVILIRRVRHQSTTPSRIALAGLLTLICVSFVESVYSGNGTFGHSVTTFSFWISAFYLGSIIADDTEQFATLGIFAIPLAGLSLWQTATGSNPYNHLVGALHFASVETYEGLQRSTSTFGHPLVAGAALTILAFAATVGRRGKYPVAVFVLLGAVVTVSRSALLGMVVILVVAIAQGAARRRIVITFVVIAAAIFITVLALPRFASSLEGRLFNQAGKEVARSEGPKELFRALSSDPLSVAFGEGIGTTTRKLTATGGVGSVNTYDDQFIDSTFDVGFIPMLAALCMLGFAIAKAERERRMRFLPVVGGAIVMLLFFDGLSWPSYAVLFWLMLGALTARSASPKPPRGRALAGCGAAIAARRR